jgi:hypothetical protein
MGWAGHAAGWEDMGDAFRILVENPKKRDQLRDVAKLW